GFTSGKTAGRRSRKTAGSKKGKRGEEIRAARQRGPVFLRRRRAAFVAFWIKNGPSLRYKRAAFEISEEHHHVIVAADSDERVGHP
ncbi:TPA: hypothetical protein ACWS0O_005458, partial [Klebsiella pneumoniae]